MIFAVIVSIALLALFWLLRRTGWSAPARSSFYGFATSVFATLTPPWANTFWDAVGSTAGKAAQQTRKLYTGDGRTYNLYILYYVLALYVAGGGIHYLWPTASH